MSQKFTDKLQEDVSRKRKITELNDKMENKNKEITDSINYAKRIQYTLLAHADFLAAQLGKDNYFTLFQPLLTSFRLSLLFSNLYLFVLKMSNYENAIFIFKTTVTCRSN